MRVAPANRWFRLEKVLLLSTGLVLFAGTPAYGALPARLPGAEYRYDVWRTEQGLPQNTVRAIFQSRNGYLWFRTRFGLVRFDGVSFRIFDRANAPALVGDTSIGLVEDQDESLWIATEFGVVRHKDQMFTAFSPGGTTIRDIIKSLASSHEGGVWIGTESGLVRLRGGGFTRYTQKDGLKADGVLSLLEDHAGLLWVGTRKGLQCFDVKKGQFSSAEGFVVEIPILSIYEDRSHHIWVGTLEGLHRWNGRQWTTYRVKDGLPADPVLFVSGDREGSLWIITSQGPLYGNPIVTPASGSLVRFHDGQFIKYGRQEGLSDDKVWCLYEDREGNLWVGTEFGGLNRMQPRRITSYTAEDGLGHDNAWSICESRDGNVWIGTDEGLNLLKDGRFSLYSTARDRSPNPVKALYEDRAGNLWVGTMLSGLNLFQNGKFIRVKSRSDVAYDTVHAILEDRDQNLWIGTTTGLGRLTKGEWKTFTTEDGLSRNDVRALHQDRSGGLWIGTYGGGLNRYRDGQFVAFTTREGLSDNYAWSIHEDAEGVLWIGTENGLNRLENGRITVFRPETGLFDNVVNNLLEDDRHNFWISCNRGIYRVSKEDLDEVAKGQARSANPISYGTSDGMVSSETNGENQPAGCKTRDGRLWFPTTQGIVVIDPERITRNELPPPVVIEAVRVDRVPVRTDRMAQLQPGQGNVVEFRYTANSLVAPERVCFKYFLEGCDTDWTEAGNRRVAFYTNLGPGDYRFQVIACNNHGVWNESGASFVFHIPPHFYQTRLSYALCGLAVILGGYGLHRLRLRVLRRIELLEQQNAVDRERARIASEIHDDLGASLTQIALLSELANRDFDHRDRAQEHIRKISTTAHGLFRAMDEVVWAVNPKHDSLASSVAYFCRYAQKYLQPAGIRCRLDVPVNLPEYPLSAEQRHNLFLVFKEAMNNIVKHAAATEVWVRVQVTPASCKISVEDNGHGFVPKESPLSGHGLVNMKRRVESIGGQFNLETQRDQGTKLEVTLKLNSAAPKR